MDYNEFAQKIKTKYPQYNDMDNFELAQKMVKKYPEYKDVSFDKAPQRNFDEQGNQIKPLEGGVSFDWDTAQQAIKEDPAKALDNMLKQSYTDTVPKTPLGLWSGAWKGFKNTANKAQQILGGKWAENKINEMRASKGQPPIDFNKINGIEEPQGGWEKTGAFIGETAPYLMLPEAKLFQGAGLLSRLGNSALTAGYQGGAIGGINSLADKGDLSGLGSGTAIGTAIGTVLPLGGAALTAGAKPIGKAAEWLTSKFTGLTPKTIQQALKPNSKALDLNEDTAQNLLMDTTERVRAAYNDLLSKRGQDVHNAIQNLGENPQRISIQDLKDDITGTFNQYQRDRINPARNMTGSLEKDLTDLIDQGSNPYILDDLGLTPGNNKAMTTYSPTKEAEAYDILSTVTGKGKNWIKSRLNNTNARKGGTVDVQAENFAKLLEDAEKTNPLFADELSSKTYNHYLTRGRGTNGESGMTTEEGQNLVQRAYDDIANGNFQLNNSNPLDIAMNTAEDEYKRIMGEYYRNSANPQAIDTAEREIASVIKNLPEEVQEDYWTRYANDVSEIYNAMNTVSPMALQGMKEQIGKSTVWSDETARNYKNPILEQLYGTMERRLSKLSPELKEANKEYSKLRKFQRTEGLKRLLKPGDDLDKASSELKNYNNTITKGNTRRNALDLENILKANGTEGFLSDIDDINAAQELLKLENTGQGGLSAFIKRYGAYPALKLMRGINRNEGLQTLYNNLGQEVPRWLMPLLYGSVNSRR